MAYLILKLIQDSSEKALEHLRLQLETLKISSITGEDVEVVVSLIKATHRVLKCASSKTKSYVPNDFVRTVFMVFQTTSVPEFNILFKDEQRRIQKAADMEGARPVWPPVSKVLNLATNSYRRMKASGEWLKPGKKTAFTGDASQSSEKKKTFVIICWNCGGQHLLKECPKPKDEKRIQAARKKFNEARKKRKGKTPPKHKTGEDGKPMILNKNGVYVLDQKAYKASQSSSTSDKSSSNKDSGSGGTTVTSPAANVTTTSDPSSMKSSEQGNSSNSKGVTFRADAVRSILRRSS
jgi:DNA-directed RNA polymerase subunit RPC12/RpoP